MGPGAYSWLTTLFLFRAGSGIEKAGGEGREAGLPFMAVVLRYDNPECELALNPAYCVGDTRGRGQRLQA